MFQFNQYKIYNKCMILEHWSEEKNKTAKISEYYKLNLDFSVHRRYSYSLTIKKIIEAQKTFCIDAITHNSNL